MSKVGRNDACPCGSGKKYKRCCGPFASRLGASGITHPLPLNVLLHDQVRRGQRRISISKTHAFWMPAANDASTPKCRCAHRASKNFVSVARHFFQVLRDQGRCSVPTTVPRSPSPIEILLEELDQHLREARGLTSSTRERHLRDLRPLLEGKYGGNAVDPAAITVAEVRRWVAARAASTSPRTARQTATAIRSLVRFFVFQGGRQGIS